MTTAADCPACPLCGNRLNEPFYTSKIRPYWRCSHCTLVFVPQPYWLTAEEERATYDLHENQLQDQGYRNFLSRLIKPLAEKLAPNQQGLDFGCGPGPALARMLEEQGHQLDLFDLHYHKDPAVFGKKYDFICATEVVEHLHDPNKEFTRLFSMLKPAGWLGIMTKLVIDKQAFSQWHYIRDLSHICFYSQDTFEYLAHRFNADLSFGAKDVILLQKR
jgi:2-polyprenyl-3-methyl-5-hydroxy-6-metoxy-1,4-benzoquinol methylase